MTPQRRSPASRTVPPRVSRFLRAHGLDSADGPLIAGVSGGPDSICLLHVLAELRGKRGMRLHAAHLDHGLRGEESADDAAYVAQLCDTLKVPLTSRGVDVAAYRKEHRLSLEEAARECRHAFFADVAGETGASAVVLGHTADDQAETVLLHMTRGAGLAGLAGMRPLARRTVPQESPSLQETGAIRLVTFARPLLTTRRSETAAYCAEHDLAPRLDSSNLSTEPVRNRVRLEIMPQLGRLNPSVTQALNRVAAASREAADLLDQQAAEAWPSLARRDEAVIALDRGRLESLPRPVAVHVLRRAAGEMQGGLRDLSFDHYTRMLRLAAGPPGKVLHLPRGLIFSVAYDVVRLERTGAPSRRATRVPETRLCVPGVTRLPGWEVRSDIVQAADGGAADSDDSLVAHLDARFATQPLWVRGRRDGDRLQPAGMSGTKKLQDLFVDAKVPRAQRDAVPLVCDVEGILWVAGHRLAARALPRLGASSALRVQLVRAAPTPPRSPSLTPRKSQSAGLR